MTDAELAVLVKRWKRRIRLLQGWNITARFAKTEAEVTDEKGCRLYACVNVERVPREADIIVRPDEMLGDLKRYPVEWNLLHEMGHIIRDHHDRETCVDAFGEALMKAYEARDKRTKQHEEK